MTEPERRTDFLRAYLRHRMADQAAWHERRSTQYRSARRWTTGLSAALLAAAALFGALGAADASHRALWAFLATTGAAIAAALTAYESAFGFEQLSRQYGDTAATLHLLRATAPSPLEVGGIDGERVLREYVERAELVLRSDVSNWSQAIGQRARHRSED